MGQAKQRGTFEQRKAESVIKRNEEQRKIHEERIAYEAALTPAQRNKENKVRGRLTALLTLAALGSMVTK